MNFWRQRPEAERRRLALAGGIIILLLGWLLGQWLLELRQEMERWRQLDRQGEQLLLSVPMRENDWQRLSRQNGLILRDLAPQGDGWQLHGQGAGLEAVQVLLEQASARGWYTRDWQVNAHADGVEFEFVFQAIHASGGSS